MTRYFVRAAVCTLALSLTMVACSKGQSKLEIPLQTYDNGEDGLPSPHTGNPVFENETTPAILTYSPGEDPANKTMFVFTTQLNVRSAPDTTKDNIVGRLGLNDEVLILAEIVNTDFVDVKIVKTAAKIGPAAHYYVAHQYLSEKKNEDLPKEARSRYFMIQNIATEKLRIYEKGCETGSCAHKLILEADMAAGEKTKDAERMTVMGFFHIREWVKYYQDAAAHYPSWYDPAYPPPPKPGARVTAWINKKVLPSPEAKVRGAFGWYAALVAPNSHSQWTHGTIGWGADKDKYIKATRGFWANVFTDPRSHGCSRTDNETIAYVRHLLPAGTPLLKIYAIEELADSRLTRYTEKTLDWQYIMTKNDVRKSNGQEADSLAVLAANTPKEQYLEEGKYVAHVLPTVKKFKPGSHGAKSSKNGNIYGLETADMRGQFLIDEGRLVGYQHPEKLDVGGYGRNEFPPFVLVQ